jgi:hypothetical protein
MWIGSASVLWPLPEATALLLDQHRGWLRREGLFLGLPARIDWAHASGLDARRGAGDPLHRLGLVAGCSLKIWSARLFP